MPGTCSFAASINVKSITINIQYLFMLRQSRPTREQVVRCPRKKIFLCTLRNSILRTELSLSFRNNYTSFLPYHHWRCNLLARIGLYSRRSLASPAFRHDIGMHKLHSIIFFRSSCLLWNYLNLNIFLNRYSA